MKTARSVPETGQMRTAKTGSENRLSKKGHYRQQPGQQGDPPKAQTAAFSESTARRRQGGWRPGGRICHLPAGGAGAALGRKRLIRSSLAAASRAGRSCVSAIVRRRAASAAAAAGGRSGRRSSRNGQPAAHGGRRGRAEAEPGPPLGHVPAGQTEMGRVTFKLRWAEVLT